MGNVRKSPVDFDEEAIPHTSPLTGRLANYEYLAYLRHHGFPSPLLDWTKSAHIAAFFAFRGHLSHGGRVAIFTYCENPGVGSTKVGPRNGAKIRTVGSTIRTHRRHFLQQCEYTYCCSKTSEWYYRSHQEVFDRDYKSQDIVEKFTIPASERTKALGHLDDLNINAFSLFGSEDGLVSSLAVREFLFRN